MIYLEDREKQGRMTLMVVKRVSTWALLFPLEALRSCDVYSLFVFSFCNTTYMYIDINIYISFPPLMFFEKVAKVNLAVPYIVLVVRQLILRVQGRQAGLLGIIFTIFADAIVSLLLLMCATLPISPFKLSTSHFLIFPF